MIPCNVTIIFTKSITCKNAKTRTKYMLPIKNLIYSIPSIHSHPPLWTLKAKQNDDLILVLTHESIRNAILPFGKLCHTKQNHCANTFASTESLLLYSPAALRPSAGGSIVPKIITAFTKHFCFALRKLFG